jgi:hypothetical protein
MQELHRDFRTARPQQSNASALVAGLVQIHNLEAHSTM